MTTLPLKLVGTLARVPLTHGPDISHYETGIDFHAMRAGGIDRVICKATEGTGYTDPTYLDNYTRAKSVGLVVFAYVFLQPGNTTRQLSHFSDTTHLVPGDGQPIVDAETQGLGRSDTFQALRDLEMRGFRPILYASLSFWRDVLLSPLAWPLWLAAYRPDLPALPDGLTLFGWQHTDQGTCPGVPRPVDMSYYYGDLNSYIIGGQRREL